MPNHVTNIIEIKGDPARIKSLFEAVKNDEYGLGSIDFKKLIPMPPELDIEKGSRTNRGLKAYKDFIEVYTFNSKKENFDLSNIPEKAEQAFLRVRPDIDPAAWELGKKAFQNQQRWGFTTWYGFCTNRWGTKWNAYGYEDGVQFDGHSLRFLTAWAPPTPIITKLAHMYPDLDFIHIPSTNLATKGDSITFSTPTIEGTVLRRNKEDEKSQHPWKAEVTEGDSGVTAAIISNWYKQVYEPAYTTDISGEG